MRVLFLTQIVPYPPDAGPRVKTWNVLRYLAKRGHEIELVTYVRSEEKPHVDAVREICAQVHVVPLDRSRLKDAGHWLRSLATGRPFLVERDDRRMMHSTIKRLMAERHFDVIHADQLTMAQFAADGLTISSNGSGSRAAHRQPRRILDAHNAVWTVVDRMRKRAPLPLQPLLALEAGRIRRYEGEIVSTFDGTLAVSEVDRQALLEAVNSIKGRPKSTADNIAVVPIAVDTKQLRPLDRNPRSNEVVTLGTLHYPPNADGIRWFLADVFPQVKQRVPEATLTIIGKNPPAELRRLADGFGQTVRVTGYVPDLGPHLRRAAALVVPVRAGGGMRVRILEGFARAMPMVTTTVGLEGIEAQPGRDILVADGESEFAASVARLINDKQLAGRLAANGRELVVERYDWQVVLQQLERFYRMATSA